MVPTRISTATQLRIVPKCGILVVDGDHSAFTGLPLVPVYLVTKRLLLLSD